MDRNDTTNWIDVTFGVTEETALWSEIKTVKDFFVVPFLCAFTNIITLKSSFQENRLLGYEYLNKKARKEWWSSY